MNRSLVATIEAANDELIGNGNLNAADAFFTPDYVVHLTEHDMKGGPGAVRRFVSMLHRGFSNIEVEVEILLEGQDRVSWQRTVRGTHDGEFMGFPPTQRPILWRDMITSRFRDGLITEEWAVSDLAERLLLARKA